MYEDPFADFMLFAWLGGFLLSVCVYFIPSLIAALRSHARCWPVFLLNLLLGWTLVGWMAALVWAVRGRPDTRPSAGGPFASVAEPNERLAEELARASVVDSPDWYRLTPAIIKAVLAALFVVGTGSVLLYVALDAILGG